MRKFNVRAGIGAFLAVAAVAVPAALAIDLTGVWQGEQNCDRYDGRKFNSPYKNDTMYITQHDDEAFMVALCNSEGCGLHYRGTVIDDAKEPGKKGQAGFNYCAPDVEFPYQEVLRADKLEIQKGPDAHFEGNSIFHETGETFASDVGSCTWKYKRVSAEDPRVRPCFVSPDAPVNGAVKGKSPRGP